MTNLDYAWMNWLMGERLRYLSVAAIGQLHWLDYTRR